MKKTFYIFFVSVYILINLGITVSAHFCRGEMHSFSFMTAKEQTDPCHGEHSSCSHSSCSLSCCADVVKIIKLEDTYTTQNKFQIDSPSAPVLYYFVNQDPTFNFTENFSFILSPPPGILLKDIPILNSSFLI